MEAKSIYNHILSELNYALAMVEVNLRSAMEFRAAFLMQIFGMILNNSAFVLIWIFFFQTFGSINDWSVTETIGLQGMIAIIYSLLFTFGAGIMQLPDIVNTGYFDNFLLTPRNLYLRIATNSIQVSAIGDMLYGVVLLIVYALGTGLDITQILLLLIVLPGAALLLISLTMCAALVCFYIPDAFDITKNLFEIFFSPAMYPSSLYQGSMRFIFLFVIPSLAIGGLPIEAVRDFNLAQIMLIWALAIIWFYFSVFLLRHAIKRYESGNLVAGRVV